MQWCKNEVEKFCYWDHEDFLANRLYFPSEMKFYNNKAENKNYRFASIEINIFVTCIPWILGKCAEGGWVRGIHLQSDIYKLFL